MLSKKQYVFNKTVSFNDKETQIKSIKTKKAMNQNKSCMFGRNLTLWVWYVSYVALRIPYIIFVLSRLGGVKNNDEFHMVYVIFTSDIGLRICYWNSSWVLFRNVFHHDYSQVAQIDLLLCTPAVKYMRGHWIRRKKNAVRENRDGKYEIDFFFRFFETWIRTE